MMENVGKNGCHWLIQLDNSGTVWTLAECLTMGDSGGEQYSMVYNMVNLKDAS